jgi:type VI protein secretion system component VasF
LIQPATIGDVQKYDPKLRQIERAAAAAEAVERAKTATGSDLGVLLRFPRWATFIFAVVIAVLLMLLIWWGVMIYNRV